MLGMIDLLQDVFIGFYLVVLLLLCMYGLHRYSLVYLFYKHKSNAPRPDRTLLRWPKVTVQLPVFNEEYVVERLLYSIKKLDYPKHLLQIQLLDDSTDDTQRIGERVVEEMRIAGYDISYLHRADRQGYKAGALRFGLGRATGEFIAIFDADFTPDAQFLRRMLPYFGDEQNGKVGMVQARWGYLNREYSLLTNLQSIFLDAHFIIEHLARNRSGRFFNFNGTAGIWRKACLLSAGNWQSDTLTEDLDISYRAQLQGWKFVFAEDVVAPSELPVQINGFKGQQYRWAKGSIQTAFKLLGSVLRSRHRWTVKLETFFHLTNNVAYLLMIFLSLSMLPSMIIRFNMGWQETIWIDVPLLVTSTVAVTVFYLTSQKALYRRWYLRTLYIPLLMGLGIGISLNNGKAVLAALLGRESDFKRTPKHGIVGNQGSWKDKKYWGQIDYVVVGELLMTAYFAFSIYIALLNRIYVAIPFLLLFQFGFAYVFFLSVFEAASRHVRKPLNAYFQIRLRSRVGS
jgi:cellulose synthase/poly-beta-1,6-N-acetylglucosamine synthase-like glycosyltransferase